MDLVTLIIFVLIGLVILAFLWAFIFLIAHTVGFIVRLATKNHPHSVYLTSKAIKLGYLGALALLAYQTYTAIYPNDGFYLGEFELASGRKPPEEVIVLFKDATYPDFHGDYCSFSRLEINPQSYRALLKQLSEDPRFTGSESSQFSMGYVPNVKLPPVRVIRYFQRNDVESDHHYTISFLEKETLLEVQICVT